MIEQGIPPGGVPCFTLRVSKKLLKKQAKRVILFPVKTELRLPRASRYNEPEKTKEV